MTAIKFIFIFIEINIFSRNCVSVEDLRVQKYRTRGIGGEFGNFEAYTWGSHLLTVSLLLAVSLAIEFVALLGLACLVAVRDCLAALVYSDCPLRGCVIGNKWKLR